MKQGQFPVIFNLTDLNGGNGFKMDGEAAGDQSGFSVNAAGDLHGDGYADFILGAPYHSGKIGRSYIIFGSPQINEGVLELFNLNGVNGFKIDGINGQANEVGYSVSDAGDVNGDKFPDIIIGAPFYSVTSGAGTVGVSYLILGGPKFGNGGLISLGILNGTNGVALIGQVNNGNPQYSGYAVSGTDDINGDGYSDFVIGAPDRPGSIGISFVLFGGPALITSATNGKGTMHLGPSNGTTGYMLKGEYNGDNSGTSVSRLKDINGDGYPDFSIGAPNNSDGGHSYVVFGTNKIVSGGVLPLANLNGANGFKITGEKVGDQSGRSLDGAGDVNGDGYNDVIIGAPNHELGRSYVIFGGSKVGSDSAVSLGSLVGSNGFKIDGEINLSLSGFSVSGAGDFNGDGYDDIVIGATNFTNFFGRSYVVFGGRQVGSNGLISLSDLNGQNGFKLQGEAENDGCGYSVHGVGDVNGDGCDDIVIGAPFYNQAGRSYLIFGDTPPQLINNTLTLYTGEKLLLNATYLAATDRNHDNASLIFVPSGITNGQFESVNLPGKVVANFTQSQITQGEIQFIHDGSDNPPAYNISVYSPGIAWTGPSPAKVSMTFLRLDRNQLRIDQGQTVTLTSDNLSAEDSNGFTSTLVFTISGATQGQFEFSSSPGQAITEFQQQNITDHVINFVHDNSVNPPMYKVTVSNSEMTTLPQVAIIDFDALPILNNNHLTIDQSEVVRLTANELSATHPGGIDSALSFQISAVQHGNFEWSNAPGKAIIVFQQQNITDRLVNFAHDGSLNPPSYIVIVTDGRLSTDPQPATVDFNEMPILGNNQLSLNQGQTIILSSDNLSASQASRPPGELIFLISVCQHGYFELDNSPGKSILNFYQQNITDKVVHFVHDNTPTAPGYQVSVSDGHFNTQPQPASIDFDTKPVVKNNQLTLNQGQTIVLTTNNLLAAHSGTADNQLKFLITGIQQGNFALINSPNQAIDTFTQQDINDEQIQFAHDNSSTPPTYQVSATDGRASSDPQMAKIDFDAFPLLKNNQLLINQGQTITISANDLSAVQPGGSENQLYFVINNCQQGYFQLTTAPGNIITRFQQQNIADKRVQFVHDNSLFPPSYEVMVTDDRLSSSYEAARIDFDTLPLLQHNQLTIDQGQTVVLTIENLLATHGDGSNDADLSFLMTALQHGYFTWTNTSTGPIAVFRQYNISTQAVSFVHDGSHSSPSYKVSVTDGKASTNPQSASITFNGNNVSDSKSLSVGVLVESRRLRV